MTVISGVEIQAINIYLGLAIVGVFSGLGNAAGNYVFTEIIKPKIHHHLTNGKAEKLAKNIAKEVVEGIKITRESFKGEVYDATKKR